MQDPYFAVKEEVEHSVTVVVDLHKRWKELSASGKKGDEFDWTSGELLSGLRSIEWDLQDLEDTVSIVEGNRQKFQLEQSDVDERKHFIESTRTQIVALRDEVQGSAMQASPGFSTSKGKPTLPSIGKKAAGYGKVGSQDDSVEMMRAAEGNGHAQIGGGLGGKSDRASHTSEPEILGADLEANLAQLSEPSRGRHRKKKCCLLFCLLLVGLAALGGVFAQRMGKLDGIKDAASDIVAKAKAKAHEAASRVSSHGSASSVASIGGANRSRALEQQYVSPQARLARATTQTRIRQEQRRRA